MSLAADTNSANTLFCELCDFVQFPSYTEFHIHHLSHIRQPIVRLSKINPNLSAKLQYKSYKVNTGVARRSHLEHIPPLKISVVNQQGFKQFQVVKKEARSIVNSCLNAEPSFDPNESHKKYLPKTNLRFSEIEEKSTIENVGSNISSKRKSSQQHKSPLENLKINENWKKNAEAKPNHINSEADAKLGPLVPSKLTNITSKQLNTLKNKEHDKKIFDESKTIEKLNDANSTLSARKEDKNESVGKDLTNKVSKAKEVPEAGEDFLEKFKSKISFKIKTKSKDCGDSAECKKVADEQVNLDDQERKFVNESRSEISEIKKFVRVKNSTYSKKGLKLDKQNSSEKAHIDNRVRNPGNSKNKIRISPERGVDILERLTERLNNTVEIVEKSEDTNLKAMEEPLLSSKVNDEEALPQLPLSDNLSECNNGSESELTKQASPLLLTPPSSSGQEGENSNYNNISSFHQNETSVDADNVQEENNEVNENAISFSSLGNEDQRQAPAEQRNSFWTNIRGGSSAIDQPQGPLMTTDDPVPNGDDTLSSNFLHNFLGEHPQANANIPPENSEFMSLDRLAQTTQHQPSSFDLNSSDTNTPMEQLSQQVQRIPKSTSQMSVMSQHHMQAPQPPQLHTGVPLSPQHISPQQPNSYDTLTHMQPPMPPPLYQGFNMFNQNFPQQTPQQIPRPPMLQQRPQIQARPFQSLAARPRQRARVPKRNVVRLPASHEIPPPKQPRRTDRPLQARPQMPNPTAKLPSGITVTPPKNTVEASKVANVLASRGITVTPASVSRQSGNQVARSQPRSTGQSPVLNIGSGVSITSSSQSRSSGGFAVPGLKRSTPIVNHHVERPERCTTVDLTQDDEPPPSSRNRSTMGRFPCKHCGKIFASAVSLESHKVSHRTAAALPYKCDKCTAQYTTSAHLQQHKLNFHKTKQSAPDLAIPIVDLNHPGAREQLLKCGIFNFIPLAQLQSNNNGYFGVPIVQLDTNKEKAMSNLSALGAGNIFVLGKMKALAPH